MASVLSLMASAALCGAGCAAQTEDPATPGEDTQALMATDEAKADAPVADATTDAAPVKGDERIGEGKQAWWGGGWGFPGWGGGWGGGWW